MDLTSCQMVRMLPAWMRADAADAALASVVDAATRQACASARMLSVWDKIDELPEELLDELAWALDISWWDSEAPIATKRSLVKESDYVHSKLGTVAAMESVATSYLGDGRVLEWFDYGGHPHNFKIATGDLRNLKDNQERIVERILQAKRHTSKLESILLELEGDAPLHAGEGFQESSRETVLARRDAAWAFVGMGRWISDAVWVCMMPVQRVDAPMRAAIALRTSEHVGVAMPPTG